MSVHSDNFNLSDIDGTIRCIETIIATEYTNSVLTSSQKEHLHCLNSLVKYMNYVRQQKELRQLSPMEAYDRAMGVIK